MKSSTVLSQALSIAVRLGLPQQSPYVKQEWVKGTTNLPDSLCWWNKMMQSALGHLSALLLRAMEGCGRAARSLVCGNWPAFQPGLTAHFHSHTPGLDPLAAQIPQQVLEPDLLLFLLPTLSLHPAPRTTFLIILMCYTDSHRGFWIPSIPISNWFFYDIVQ